MNYNNIRIPSLLKRLISVWYRHLKVYKSNFVSNAFPPFFEPLIFLVGLGFGISGYIGKMGNVDYILFLGSGLSVTSSMYTAAFECSFGTFIRLEFDNVYDGMLGAPISSNDLIIGEIFFAGTKGMFFSFAVMSILWIVGIVNYPLSIFTIFIGFITGLMFGALSIFVTSFVKNINHFNFYFTGLISPMFFFSGIVYPIDNLPKILQYIAQIVPLTHVVKMARAFCIPEYIDYTFLFDLLYCIVFIFIIGYLAVKRLSKRIIF